MIGLPLRLMLAALPLMIGLVLAGLMAGRVLEYRPQGLALALHAEQCTLPCWQGITPGETLLEDAQRRLTDLGYFRPFASNRTIFHQYTPGPNSPAPRCEVNLNAVDSVVQRIFITRCEHRSYTGDVMSVLGAPEALHTVEESLLYADGRVWVRLAPVCDQPLQPHTPIQRIILGPPPLDDTNLIPWAGFALQRLPCTYVIAY